MMLLCSGVVNGQIGRLLPHCKALGAGDQYAAPYNWENTTKEKYLITSLVKGKITYEFSIIGFDSYVLESKTNGEKKIIANFERKPKHVSPHFVIPQLADVVTLANGDLCVLIGDSQAYTLCRFIKKDDAWQMRMFGYMDVFISRIKTPQTSDITGFSILPTGNLKLSYGKKNDVYQFSNFKTEIKLNDSVAGYAIWYDEDGKYIPRK